MQRNFFPGHEALRLADSYSRIPILLRLWEDLIVEHDQWLALLGQEWSGCDNIGLYLDQLLDESPLGDVLDRSCSGAALMTEDEQQALAMLPDSFTIYRGCYPHNQWGLSWSLDIDVAWRFPFLIRYRHPAQPLLVTAVADKAHVAALKLDRGEIEIITHPPRHLSTSEIRSPVTGVASRKSPGAALQELTSWQNG